MKSLRDMILVMMIQNFLNTRVVITIKVVMMKVMMMKVMIMKVVR